MDRACEITLIKETYSTNALGESVKQEVKKTVLGTLYSITRAEFSAASQAGLSPEHEVLVFEGDYNGERTAILDGGKYGIYRTFLRDDERVELYLTRKAGESDG